MLTLIEAYDHSGALVTIQGRTYPSCALLEDDEGTRWFLTADPTTINAHHYVRAVTAGAVALTCPLGDGFAAMTTEWFTETRQEAAGAFQATGWSQHTTWPTYAALLGTGPAPTAPRSGFVHLHTHSEFCLDPRTRVVTTDLNWKAIGDLRVGDALIGFDEDLRGAVGARGRGGGRTCTTWVQQVARVVRPCYRIVLSNGREIVASDLHPWVAQGHSNGSLTVPGGPRENYHQHVRRWVNTADLVPGKSRLVLWAEPWEALPDDQREAAAWLAGVADGEGWLHGTQFFFGQNPGVVLDKMVKVCHELGYTTGQMRKQSERGSCRQFSIQGYGETLKFLYQCRPVRFEQRWREVWHGRAIGGRYHTPVKVVDLIDLGERETVGITTTTKTFIAEGFLTHNSSWDGLSTVTEIVEQVVADNQPAVGLTDHGICAGHPPLQKECKKAGIKPIFGNEIYLVADRHSREPAVAPMRPYNHLIMLAQDNQGLRNVWGASTESYRDGFYGKPRMDYETLARFSEGVIASTGCLSGPLCEMITLGDEMGAKARLATLLNIFGDRLYVEIHANSLPEQRVMNEALVRLARENGVPLLAVVDSHFPTKDDLDLHRVWMACATRNEVVDDVEIIGYNEMLYVQSEADVRANLAYLPDDVVAEAVSNTVLIADKCDAAIPTSTATPVYSKVGGAERDAERLLEDCMANWERRTSGKPYTQEAAITRFEHEFPMLVRKGFCGYYLMTADYVRHAKDNRVLVGPGRGSGGGSFVAYLCGITEIDPIEGELLFERFMTEGRTALPDFDIDFPSSKRQFIQNYVRDKYGEDYVVRVGTHLRFKNKGVIKQIGSALHSQLPETWFADQKKISEIITQAEAHTAGLGLSWEELWAQEGDQLEPFRERYPVVFFYAERLVGRINSYGKHAAGLVISTDQILTDTLPLRGGEDGESMVSQFDMRVLEEMGLLKCDFLTLRNLDTIQDAIDLIAARRGTQVNIYDWKEEYEDPQVWDEISAGHTLGIFQIETSSGTQLTKRMQPSSLSELSDTITLVRPGPKRSGLQDLYLDRRSGKKPVEYPDPRMEGALAKTYGTMLYQEDIMAACMILGGYDGNEADEVRKILGKKQVEKTIAAGEKFIARCAELGMVTTDAQVMWAQIAEFAKYSFNRAHAYAYAVLGYWCAWLKFHYPVEFLTAALTTVDKDRIPDFIKEARRMGYAVQPPDINESGVGFKGSALAVRYGLDAIKGIAAPTVEEIVAGQPYTSFEDFMERAVKVPGAKVNMGHVALLVRIGAFDALVPNRRGLETLVTAMKTGEDTFCKHKDTTYESPFRNPAEGSQPLPCRFDWSAVPPILGRTGKPLKDQSKALPPKKCTKSCRQYVARDALDVASIEPYTDADIRDIEQEMLKTFLSSTPFDRLAEQDREDCREMADAAINGRYPRNQPFVTVGFVVKIKPHTTTGGKQMAFLGIETEAGVLDMAVFADEWARYRKMIDPMTMVLVVARPGDKGNILDSLEVLQ